MFTQIRPALTMIAVMTLITGVIYPLAMTGAAQAVFPRQAAGSSVKYSTEPPQPTPSCSNQRLSRRSTEGSPTAGAASAA